MKKEMVAYDSMTVLEVEPCKMPQDGFALPSAEYALAWFWWPALLKIAQAVDQDLVLTAVPVMIAWVEARRWPLMVKSQLLKVLNDLLLNPDIFGKAETQFAAQAPKA